MPLTARDASRALAALLDYRERRSAEVRPARVVGHDTDGAALLERLDGECIVRGGAGGLVGEIVVELPSLLNRRGTTGVAVARQSVALATLWLERLDPDWFPQGSAGLVVDVYGSGFTPTTVFAFGVPGGSEALNPDVEIVSTTFVDSGHCQLVVDVAPGANLWPDPETGLPRRLPVHYDDPARRLL